MVTGRARPARLLGGIRLAGIGLRRGIVAALLGQIGNSGDVEPAVVLLLDREQVGIGVAGLLAKRRRHPAFAVMGEHIDEIADLLITDQPLFGQHLEIELLAKLGRSLGREQRAILFGGGESSLRQGAVRRLRQHRTGAGEPKSGGKQKGASHHRSPTPRSWARRNNGRRPPAHS